MSSLQRAKVPSTTKPPKSNQSKLNEQLMSSIEEDLLHMSIPRLDRLHPNPKSRNKSDDLIHFQRKLVDYLEIRLPELEDQRRCRFANNKRVDNFKARIEQELDLRCAHLNQLRLQRLADQRLADNKENKKQRTVP